MSRFGRGSEASCETSRRCGPGLPCVVEWRCLPGTQLFDVTLDGFGVSRQQIAPKIQRVELPKCVEALWGEAAPPGDVEEVAECLVWRCDSSLCRNAMQSRAHGHEYQGAERCGASS